MDGLTPSKSSGPTPGGNTHSVPGPFRVVSDEDGFRIEKLKIDRICRGRNTQGRSSLSSVTVRTYAQLMAAGVIFPPVRVWTDGNSYWLTDGFHRVAAAESLGLIEVTAEIRFGAEIDAQWDCYSGNIHGLPRSKADVKRLIGLVFEHPNSLSLSTNQVSRHLSIPEATVRRYRRAISSSQGKKTVRVATRGGKTYKIETAAIGQAFVSNSRKRKTLREWRQETAEMKASGSPDVRRVINVFEKWMFGDASATDCVASLARILQGSRLRANGNVDRDALQFRPPATDDL
jgi:hypothetical protein